MSALVHLTSSGHQKNSSDDSKLQRSRSRKLQLPWWTHSQPQRSAASSMLPRKQTGWESHFLNLLQKMDHQLCIATDTSQHAMIQASYIEAIPSGSRDCMGMWSQQHSRGNATALPMCRQQEDLGREVLSIVKLPFKQLLTIHCECVSYALRWRVQQSIVENGHAQRHCLHGQHEIIGLVKFFMLPGQDPTQAAKPELGRA